MGLGFCLGRFGLSLREALAKVVTGRAVPPCPPGKGSVFCFVLVAGMWFFFKERITCPEHEGRTVSVLNCVKVMVCHAHQGISQIETYSLFLSI